MSKMKNSNLYWLLLLVPLFWGGKKVFEMTRGLRNNNPGNIKEMPGDKTQWLGERATDDDPVFEEFTAPVYGIRALARILNNYRNLYGLNTIREIITRWAPGSENDTESYVRSVEISMQKSANEILNFDSDLSPLVQAIIKHENGVQPYSLETIGKGISLA